MTNNDIFRRLRYAIDLGNTAVVQIFALSGSEVTPSEVVALLKKEGEEGYLECTDEQLGAFLDGLVAYKRGKREGGTTAQEGMAASFSNNDILKKLRIALELKEEEMLDLFRLSQFRISKSELSALFRAKGHPNYKECGDQILRNFLRGLTLKNRGDEATKPPPRPSK